jgi:tight adherence protein C
MLTVGIIALLIGLSVTFVIVGLASPPQPSEVQNRLEQYGSRPRSLAEIELQAPFSERVLVPLVRSVSGFVQRLTPTRNIEEVRHKLDLAGNPNNWMPADFMGVRGLAAIIIAILVFLGLLLSKSDLLQTILFAGIGGFLGFYLPMFWLNSKIGARKHEMQKALPDALDLLTISVEAGLGFDAAIAKITEKSDNELSRAFGRVNAEIRLGKLRREALRDMANRSDVPDITNFIAAVIQADQLGVSLAKVLRIQSDQMRIKRRQHAEEEAAAAPVKMMIPLVFLIFPSLFVVLLGPAIIILKKSGLGG